MGGVSHVLANMIVYSSNKFIISEYLLQNLVAIFPDTRLKDGKHPITELMKSVSSLKKGEDIKEPTENLQSEYEPIIVVRYLDNDRDECNLYFIFDNKEDQMSEFAKVSEAVQNWSQESFEKKIIPPETIK
jgi:hypothetical protein